MTILIYICKAKTVNSYIMIEHINKLIAGSLVVASAVSCVNPEYDLEKIQLDEVHALDNISVPVGDSRKILLSELLDNEEFGEYLKTYDNEDYYFNFLNGKKDQSVDVPDFYFEGYDEDHPHSTTIETPIIIGELSSGEKFGPIPFSEISYDIEIDQYNIPDFILNIEHADVITSLILKFEYDQTKFPFKKIYLEEGMKVKFPEWVILGQAPMPFIRINDHELQNINPLVITPSNTEVVIPLDALDFMKMPEGQGFIGDGHLFVDDDVTVSGNLYMMSEDCTQTGEFYPIMTTYLHMDPMEIESVKTKVDLSKIAFIETSFQLDEMTEFLENEDCTLDLDGLKLDLGVETTIPFAIDLYASAESYASGSDEPMWHDDFNLLDIPAGTADAPSVSSYSFELDGFPLYPIPEKIDFSLLPLVSDMKAVEIHPGASYDIAVDYSLTCDAFGKDFRIGVTEDFTDLGLEIHEVDLDQVHLKFTLTNALPFDFNLSVLALDAEGNVLETITAETDGEIKGGTVESPAVNHLTVNLVNKGDLVLDGVRLSMSAEVSGERAVLNKDQFVQITDMSISLPQGITYYINENN